MPCQNPRRRPKSPGLSPQSRSGAIQTSGLPDLGVPWAPPSRPALQLTWVPLPAPGGPSSTARMPLGRSGAGSDAGTLGAMAAEASHCSTRQYTSQVQRFQASSTRTPRTPRSPLTLVHRHVRQSLPPAPERDGHFNLPTTRRSWGRLLFIGQNLCWVRKGRAIMDRGRGGARGRCAEGREKVKQDKGPSGSSS